jgi:hypothetical protein
MYLFCELSSKPADRLYLEHHGAGDYTDLYNFYELPTYLQLEV